MPDTQKDLTPEETAALARKQSSDYQARTIEHLREINANAIPPSGNEPRTYACVYCSKEGSSTGRKMEKGWVALPVLGASLVFCSEKHRSLYLAGDRGDNNLESGRAAFRPR